MLFPLGDIYVFIVSDICAYPLGDRTGRVAQLVMCLNPDTCPNVDPGVQSSTLARFHTFVEIDHEIISTAIILPFTDSFMEKYCLKSFLFLPLMAFCSLE